MASKRSVSPEQAAIVQGHRSGLEGTIQRQLEGLGEPGFYEAWKIPWHLSKHCKYTPDFTLVNGIIIESKGRFVTADRQKHLFIKSQHPELDIRFVFSRSAGRISKTSKTTYGKWCETKGFQYADRLIPQAWLDEPPNEASLEAIRKLLKEQGKELPL